MLNYLELECSLGLIKTLMSLTFRGCRLAQQGFSCRLRRFSSQRESFSCDRSCRGWRLWIRWGCCGGGCVYPHHCCCCGRGSWILSTCCGCCLCASNCGDRVSQIEISNCSFFCSFHGHDLCGRRGGHQIWIGSDACSCSHVRSDRSCCSCSTLNLHDYNVVIS